MHSTWKCFAETHIEPLKERRKKKNNGNKMTKILMHSITI